VTVEVILTAHQPVYLPWLGLFHKIALADVFVLFDDVQYLPKDWNNRNKIKTRTGPLWLTVPVLTAGHREKVIREIEVNNDLPWQRKHWRSLQLNYKDAPFFLKYASFFEDVYTREWRLISDLNEHMLQWFLGILGIKVQFLKASDYGFRGKKSDLVLNMCRQLRADRYIFGALGREYAEVTKFQEAGIKVVFQEYDHPTYSQQHGGFISHLSVVDLLFNCGDSSFDVLMSGNLNRIAVLAGG
jgi:hypothetical protein